MKHNITVVSGTRAEFGLLRPVLEKLKENTNINFSLVVTGSHLSHEHGYTASEIYESGFPPCAEIDILSGEDPNTRAGTAKITAKALNLFLEYFSSANPLPDVLLLLGDRYEIFAVGQAAALLNFPVAHISGGDVTFGADDDWFRHCLTKISKLHFPSCETYRQRVIQMGENPKTVFNVGGLGDENIRNMKLLSTNKLSESIGINLKNNYALVTFHPETQSNLPPQMQGEILLSALQQNTELFYIITKAGGDAGGLIINDMLEKFCRENNNAVLFSSLGALRYLSTMKYANLVLGNSSSGIAETPSFGVPCVNIGNRQSGRVHSLNIINCAMNNDAISTAIKQALTTNFKNTAKNVKSPYNGGDTSGKIVKILVNFLNSGKRLNPKVFFDVNYNI